MYLVAVVGMTGSGKTEVSRVLEQRAWTRLRFGDVTDDELKRRGLPRIEKHERVVREELRAKHGMAAYAKLMIPKIEAALEKGHVVLDGMYSWEEYLVLKEKYTNKFTVLAVYGSPETRHERLGSRKERPLTGEEASSRDKAEIENINKGGPIAVADYTIINEGSLDDIARKTNDFLVWLENKAGKA